MKRELLLQSNIKGNLLTSSSGADWKLNLIFENTPLSDNLQLNDTQKQHVNLIIK